MQKGLCYVALTISLVVLLLFLADLILGLSGMPQLAPFKNASLLTDIIFIVASLILAVMSFYTLRDQV